MFVTNYGSFNGSSWEIMMQVVFKDRYRNDQYQRVKPSPGDFGIEGFTRTGLVFQCYCPDSQIPDDRLYEKQRDKITEDLRKLATYAIELNQILGGIKVRNWILVTPKMSHHKLLTHCNTKRDEIRLLNLPFVDTNFEVLIHEGEDYSKEIGAYFTDGSQKLNLSPIIGADSSTKIVTWRDTEIDLVNNALLKNEFRLTSLNSNPDPAKVNSLTDDTVRKFLNGESMLRTWQDIQPENHQRFTELLSSVEEELKEKCMLNNAEPEELVDFIKGDVETKIRETFPHLETSTVTRLKNYAISYWLLNCSLYFENMNNNDASQH